MTRLPSSTSLIRVAVVEDDVTFQQSLAESLRAAPDMALHGVADTCARGLQLLERAAADVLLVDLGLPDGSGLEVIRAAHARWPHCNIMVSTAFGDELHVMQSLEAGATGYLLKDSRPEKIIFEIRNLHAGGSPISPLIARQILMRFVRGPSSAAPTVDASKKLEIALSGREKEVLELITRGYSVDECATLISVSRHTVVTYVRRIYVKLEVRSKTEAVFEARKRGLLDD